MKGIIFPVIQELSQRFNIIVFVFTTPNSDLLKTKLDSMLKEKVIVVTARHKRLLSKLEDFSNDMKKELEEQWKDFESFIQLIILNQ